MIEEVDLTLQRIAQAFTVRDIMTPRDSLAIADNPEEAKAIFEQFDYEIVPSLKSGRITHYFKQNAKAVWEEKYINSEQVISDGTSISELISLFQDRKFFFVLSTNQITGLVHFADLNALVARVPLYATFSSVENRLWSKVKGRTNPESLRQALNARADDIFADFEKKKKADVDRGWGSVLYLYDVLRLAEHFEALPKPFKKKVVFNDIPDFRNRVSHIDKDLISEHGDIGKLAEVQKYCDRILLERVDD